VRATRIGVTTGKRYSAALICLLRLMEMMLFHEDGLLVRAVCISRPTNYSRTLVAQTVW
jgi:hypothetical protein